MLVPLLLAAAIAPDSFASTLELLPDRDDDGHPELLVTDPTDRHLLVWVLSGASLEPLGCHVGPDVGPRFARATPLDDLDGDGVAEVAVAGQRGQELPPRGYARILDGRTLDVRFELPSCGAPWCGPRVRAADDADGDGVADVLVGHPVARCQAGDACGELWLCSGRDGSLLRRRAGSLREGSLGRRFLRGADLDRDGTRDVVTLEEGGDVTVLSGRTLLPLGVRLGPELALGGCSDHALATFPDIDGDGLDELLLSSYATCTPREGQDVVRLLASCTGEAALELRAATRSGEPWFGAALGAADVDGDGAPEVLVGAPRHGIATGAVRAFRTEDGGEVRRWEAELPLWNFGTGVANLGDLDGDGCDDVAVAESNPSAGTPGSVEVRSGRTGAVLASTDRARLLAALDGR